MAMARWEAEQIMMGNLEAAAIARALREQYGDVPFESNLPELLSVQEFTKISEFFGRPELVPYPSQELINTLIKAKSIGWTQAEPHFLPKVVMAKDSEFPGWTIRPEEWFWKNIKQKIISSDAAQLDGVWVIVDGTQKPGYNDGKQTYEYDPFTSLLTQLREEIKVKHLAHQMPRGSRFGLSYEDIEKYVNPKIAELLGVWHEHVRTPKAIEFNVLGNMHHPEWGLTETYEWFQDPIVFRQRLVGGLGSRGGLANVISEVAGGQFEYIGFRPMVVFPQKAG